MAEIGAGAAPGSAGQAQERAVNSRHAVTFGLRAATLVAATAAAAVFPLAVAAGAWVSGPCDGSVVIDGNAYGPGNDTAANPIVVPAERGLVADWQGSTGVVITDQSGGVGIAVGPGVVSPDAWSWSGANAEGQTSASGSTSIDEAMDLLPVGVVGIYEVRASHAGTGGACEAMAMVRMEGNPLTTPLGAAAALGAVGSAAGLALAARGRRP